MTELDIDCRACKLSGYGSSYGRWAAAGRPMRATAKKQMTEEQEQRKKHSNISCDITHFCQHCGKPLEKSHTSKFCCEACRQSWMTGAKQKKLAANAGAICEWCGNIIPAERNFRGNANFCSDDCRMKAKRARMNERRRHGKMD